jgi:glycogen operon protein
VFCRRRWFQGRLIHGSEVSDIGWFTPAGLEMSEDDWRAGFAKSLGVFLNGQGIQSLSERGEPVTDESFYVMFNSDNVPLEFTLPERQWGEQWTVLLNTADEKDLLAEQEIGPAVEAGERSQVQPLSLVLLRRIEPK